MDLVSSCPLRVASIVWQPRAGAYALTIVVKATFRLAPGVAALAEAQEDPAGDELVPAKPRADVWLLGSAYAPAGQPARAVVARLHVGAIDKRIEVWCDRIFWQDGRLLEGQPFSRMELRPERAAAGPDNPVGMRFDGPPDAHGAIRIPHLQPPGIVVRQRGDSFGSISFAPVPASSPARLQKLGRHAAGWSPEAWRSQPLPADLDLAYFNAAPRDQQLDAIDPDQRLELEALHPDHPRLETSLPGIQPRALMTSGGRAGEGVSLSADTLGIDTDRSLVFVVWRGRIPLNHPAEPGRIVVSIEDAGYGGSTLDLEPGAASPGAPVPFAEAAPAGEIETMYGGHAGGAALPFGPARSPWLDFRNRPPEVRRAPEQVDTGTLYGVKGKAHDVLPMTWNAAQPAATAVVTEVAPQPEPIAAPSSEPAPEPAPAAEAPPPREITIERCAAIRASLDRRPADAAAILRENEISPAAWEREEHRWESAIDAEIDAGQSDLLDRFDAAYVARIEEERGPLGAEDYARLVIAAERGTTEAALEALALPEAAEMRIERVWMAKLMADGELAAAVRRAKAARREDR
jgi:hypothetical protein